MAGSSAFRKALEDVPRQDPDGEGDEATPLLIKTSDLPDPLSGFEEYEAQLRALSQRTTEPSTTIDGVPEAPAAASLPSSSPTEATPAEALAAEIVPTEQPEADALSQPVMRIVAPDEPEQLVLGFDDVAVQHLTGNRPPVEAEPMPAADLLPLHPAPTREGPLVGRITPINAAMPVALDARSITPAALTAIPPAPSSTLLSPSPLPAIPEASESTPSILPFPTAIGRETETPTRRETRRAKAVETINDSLISWSFLAAAAIGLLVLHFGPEQGWFTLEADLGIYISAALGGLAGLAGITIAGRRDVISWATLGDVATLTVAVAAFSWQFPRFAPGTAVWDPDQRLPLTALGTSIGLLVAALILLALLRRPQSLSSAAFVAALGLILARLVIAPERPEVIVPALAAAGVLTIIGWLLRRRTEKRWAVPPSRLRTPRSILSLAAAAVAATGLQITVSRGDFNGAIPVIVLFVLVLVASLFSIFSSRNELREEEGAMADWLSWRKELQSGDFETSIFEYSPTANPGISEWTANGQLVHGDELFWRMLDLAPAEHCDLLASVHSDDRVDAAQAFVRAVRSGTNLSHRCRFQRDSDGMVRAFEMRGEPLPTGNYRLSLFELSPDEAKDRQTQPGLPAGPRHDPLTGVANIARLDQWLHEFALNSRRHSDAALIIIVEVGDLTLFEQADPRVRDLVLTESAHRLQSACREGDFVAHVDGPYFAVVARLATPEDEAGLVNRTQQLISGTIPVFGQELAMNGRLIPLHVDPGVVLDQVLDTAAAAFHTSGG